jgi:citrate lyase subunit beta / citryl-CoA lyase
MTLSADMTSRMIKPRRSVLYMPGSNARALEKARTLAADTIIFDLEDSVAPDMKAQARAQVCEAVRAGGYGPREVLIRVNSIETPWGIDDLVAAASARPDAILLPKVSDADALQHASEILAKAHANDALALWAMIETPLAILHIDAIARLAHKPGNRLAVFVMGLNDLAKDTRARLTPGRPAMLPWMMTALAAARAYGLDIIDGVYNDLADEAGFTAECAQGRDLGFDGKTLIHPNQIAIANTTFAPDAVEIANAQAVVSAFAKPENADKGAIALDGRMVERLHAQMATRTLMLANTIAART